MAWNLGPLSIISNRYHIYIYNESVQGSLLLAQDLAKENMTLLPFYNEKFFVRKSPVGTYDIVQWIVNGMSGEGKVSKVFTTYLGKQNRCNPSSSNRSSIVLDIGANAGVYGLYAAARNCTTYFFDVQPICQRWIYAAILANRLTNAFVIPYAVSNTSQQITVRGSNSCHGGYYLNDKKSRRDPPNAFIWSKRNAFDLTIEKLRIDSFFNDTLHYRQLPPIALIKIDVEGFEPLVIAGMKHLLASGLVENLIIEVSPPNWHRCVNMNRSEVANVFVTTLWDQGFQNVTIFKNNHKCCDLHVTSRNELFDYMATKTFQDGMQDIHFSATMGYITP